MKYRTADEAGVAFTMAWSTGTYHYTVRLLIPTIEGVPPYAPH